MRYVDSHVHLRDFKQQHKETIKHGLEVARDSGVIAVFDMPNTDPPIMDVETVSARLALATTANIPEVFYGLYMGLTASAEQVKRAVSIVQDNPQVVGMKLYAGHSVGNLGVVHEEDQYRVFETLAQQGYTGVVTVHAEKEGALVHRAWNPLIPISHCVARPAIAEVESVKDIISYARTTKFAGKLHIAHISTPEAVDLVTDARKKGVDLSCGVCPHHFVYDWSQMYGENGILLKMNPPLREPGVPQRMLELLRRGKIDWIETDHAPHTLDEKRKHSFMSGIPGLPWWDLFVAFLRAEGFTEKRIEEVTLLNVMRRFEVDIPLRIAPRKDRRADYPFNPYESLEKRLGYGHAK